MYIKRCLKEFVISNTCGVKYEKFCNITLYIDENKINLKHICTSIIQKYNNLVISKQLSMKIFIIHYEYEFL